MKKLLLLCFCVVVVCRVMLSVLCVLHVGCVSCGVVCESEILFVCGVCDLCVVCVERCGL